MCNKATMTGKIAIVTGGARGLGKSIAEKLLREGATVIIADLLEKELKETVKVFCENGLKAEEYNIDLLKVSAINEMIDQIANRHGKIDILVNNAGIQIRKKAIEFSEEDWEHLIGVNLKSYYFASTAAARVMIKQGGGAIVCISSVNSSRFSSKRSLYGISKGGVDALVATLGVEWARYGIRINAVAPGFLDTEMYRAGVKAGIINAEEVLSVMPTNRLIMTSEVASAVCFLASDEASGIVGQTLFVDGGCSKNCLPEGRELK